MNASGCFWLFFPKVANSAMTIENAFIYDLANVSFTDFKPEFKKTCHVNTK